MAKVLVILKVFPDSPERNLDELLEKIKSTLPEGVEIVQHEKVPVAFGLNLLKLYLTMPEEVEGGTSELEKAIKGVEGVSEVEVEAVHRVSY